MGVEPCEGDDCLEGVEDGDRVAMGRCIVPSAWESERIPKRIAMETSTRRMTQKICRGFRILLLLISPCFHLYFFFRLEQNRQQNAECGPATGFSFDPNATALGFDECLGNGKTDTGIPQSLNE